MRLPVKGWGWAGGEDLVQGGEARVCQPLQYKRARGEVRASACDEGNRGLKEGTEVARG